VDHSRFLVLNNSLTVIDAATNTLLEKLDLDQPAVSAVTAPDKSRMWAGVLNPPGLLEWDLEPASCAAQEPSPAMFFPADGSFESSVDATALSNSGQVVFRPGNTGQAFFLDGRSFLSAASTGYFRIYRHDFSVAFYVRFSSIKGEAALVDWSAETPRRGIAVLKSADNRFVFQAWPGGSRIASSTSVQPGVWYHVTVTKTGDLLSLFINGKAEGSGKVRQPFPQYDDPLYLGAFEPGRPSLNGWLDEIAFYNRGLTADEVAGVYRKRETGPCATAADGR
jgi:hypothetical protein